MFVCSKNEFNTGVDLRGNLPKDLNGIHVYILYNMNIHRNWTTQLSRFNFPFFQ